MLYVSQVIGEINCVDAARWVYQLWKMIRNPAFVIRAKISSEVARSMRADGAGQSGKLKSTIWWIWTNDESQSQHLGLTWDNPSGSK